MFYDDKPQNMLRFGDVVGGLILSHCRRYTPSRSAKPDVYDIAVNHPQFAAVLTPCCTIANRSGNMLTLSPLQKITPTYYFTNSYLREDLTRLNREMTIQEAIGPEKWKEMSDEQQAEYLSKHSRKLFNQSNEFVYDKHDLLPGYEIKYKQQRTELNYYKIDFRQIFKVEFDINSTAPAIKYLQLSVQARAELRDKLSHYFGRPPEEDQGN